LTRIGQDPIVARAYDLARMVEFEANQCTSEVVPPLVET
jgi:hypothetical protein